MSLPLYIRLLEKLFLALDGISKNVIPISLIPSLKRDQILNQKLQLMDLSISRPQLESPVLHLASFLSVVDDISHGHMNI